MAEQSIQELRETIAKADAAMMDTLTLLHAAFDTHERGEDVSDGITNRHSRTTALLIMAQDRAVEAIKALNY